MTPARLVGILAAIHWSHRGLADMLGLNPKMVDRWATGQAAIPPGYAGWLERAAAWLAAHPPPAPSARSVAARRRAA